MGLNIIILFPFFFSRSNSSDILSPYIASLSFHSDSCLHNESTPAMFNSQHFKANRQVRKRDLKTRPKSKIIKIVHKSTLQCVGNMKFMI